MSRSTWENDDDPVDDRQEDDFADDDFAEDDFAEDDFAEDDDEPTIACPYCGEQVHEDSPRCPHCENYLSREEFPSEAKPWWMLLGAGLGLLAFLTWLFL
jgi:uncharacterized paraquat-inducible protein A